jgi:5-methylcytosine-specific restriction endonuclease McrA
MKTNMELPDADLAVIFDQGVRLLLERVEKAKFGGAPKRRHVAAPRAYETRIRFKTDSSDDRGNREASKIVHHRERPSRHIPSAVKRAVWWRDAGQCAFVAANGRRCTERSFLELHHIHPHALDGPSTVGNIALRCRCHNAYEAELVFGVAQPRRTAPESPV